MTMKRRDALKTLGGLATVAGASKLLGACGDNRGPGKIDTFVFLMMENRTYDHVLGARTLEGLGGDGLRSGMANADATGKMIAPFPATDDHNAPASSVCDADPPHGWIASHNQFANGQMSGFVTEYQASHPGAPPEPMKYLQRANVPITWALADAYTSCDRWFASLMGPTLPNRAYWMAGTSLGIDNNSGILDAFGQGVPVPTIFHRLTEAGVNWCYYFGTIGIVQFLGNSGPYQLDLGPNDGTGRVRQFGDSYFKRGQFFEDAAAGKLPNVVYIDPGFGYNDDHPPVHPILGQELIASIYTALANSPQWERCMLVITYDEHGGYFDHVPPTTMPDDTEARYGKPGFDQLGFRVPALVVGPYVKQGHVSSVQYNHTSALRHLQNEFGLASLTARIDASTDLVDCIDFDRLAAGQAAAPIKLPTFDSEEWPVTDAACSKSGGFLTARALDPISEWCDANPSRVPAGADLRADAPAMLNSIREYLRKHQT